LRAKASTHWLYSLVRWRRTSLVIAPTACTSRKKCTMFSGRVSRGKWPRMTIRSKQWYTNASRLPNSRANSSISPLASVPLSWHQSMGQRTDGGQKPRGQEPDRVCDAAAPHFYHPPLGGRRGNFKYFW